ncbi:putative holin-like toxin [Streptococcus orisratti]|nr:putative holin-like toxin [Streptococcus orisratti]
MSVAEILQVMLGFGDFVIGLLTLVVALILLKDKK